MNSEDTPLTCEIVDGQLVIRIGVAVLAFAAMEKQKHDMNLTYRVTDVAEFARENVLALTKEEEDGSSPLTNLFDAAAVDAVEDGAVSVEYIEPPRTDTCPDCIGEGADCATCGGLGLVVESAEEDEEEPAAATPADQEKGL